MEEPIKVSSDWAKNWNGNIAIKVTAVTVWVIMVLSFVLTMPFVSSFEDRVIKEYAYEQKYLEQRITGALENKEDINKLRLSLNNFINSESSGLLYLLFEFQGNVITVGDFNNEGYEMNSLLTIHRDNKKYETNLHVDYVPLDRAVAVGRMIYGSAIVAFAVLFGMLLFWINTKIVQAPFQSLVSSTQKISQGETSLRMDESRNDEFGVLARFLNQMLDTLKSNQDELEVTNQELVSEIQHREEALAASQLKSAFLANMSHEIRTPLSSIIGYTERLRYNKARDEKDRQEMLDIVLQNGNHLLHLINDILDLSKVEANKLEVEESEFSIFNIVEHAKKLLTDKALDQDTRIVIDYAFPIPQKIVNDPVRTKQIILNLCSNAIRFTEKGIVTIAVAYESESDSLVLIIKDTGIGMTEDELARLFRPFAQADATIARDYGGTGLGLVISKRLSELMGGDIEVQSVKGLGSSFTCKIRAGYRGDGLVSSAEQVICEEEDVAIEETQFTGKLLLVEDTPEIQKLVTVYLEDFGVDIEIANNGKEGVERALTEEFDVVLMDIQMPIMNGKDAMKYLRSKNYAKPVVALTADAITQHAEEYYALGFSKILTKPIVVNKLKQVLKTYLDANSFPVEEDAGEYVKDMASAENRDTEVVSGMEDLKNKFISRLSSDIVKINIAVESDDVCGACSILHQLKGIGGSLGFPEVTRYAADATDFLQDRNIASAKTILTRMEAYIYEVTRA